MTVVSTPDERSEGTREPLRGSVVVYQRSLDDDQERFRIGVVVGPVVPEPRTGNLWVGVRLSQHAPGGPGLDFIEVDSIVDTSPPEDDTTA
ncbi:hypothetical protein [Actinophytocola sp. NPDC049390]|uniref:hypothetical protein n=1 Tax=Actinophytocola sp. NPDC049390 TaxID=3363894 RepID=UPI0037B99A59